MPLLLPVMAKLLFQLTIYYLPLLHHSMLKKRNWMDVMKSNFEVKINKEIRDYTESILLGLSLRQSIFSILACGSACIIYFLCSDKLGQEVTSWLCILGVLPFACFGFIRFQGMHMEEIISTAFYSLLLNNAQLFNKPFNLFEEMFSSYIDKSRKESIVHDKKFRKNQKAEQRKNKGS